VLLPSAYNPTPKRRTITADQNDHQDKPVNGEKIPNLRNNTVTEIEIANRITPTKLVIFPVILVTRAAPGCIQSELMKSGHLD
jgi:hypothetical protein